MFAFALTEPAAQSGTAEVSSKNVEALWTMPADITTRDLFHGPGGAELAPKPDGPFTWVATDTTGYSPGFDVRDAAGRSWSVKLGPEAQPEVVASRVLWAIGYHQPPTYYVATWQLSGGPGGTPASRAVPDRFRRCEGRWPTGPGPKIRFSKHSRIAD